MVTLAQRNSYNYYFWYYRRNNFVLITVYCSRDQISTEERELLSVELFDTITKVSRMRKATNQLLRLSTLITIRIALFNLVARMGAMYNLYTHPGTKNLITVWI